MKSRLLLRWVLAALALGFLVAMVVAGALPRQRALVKFEAAGVMSQAPETIDHVEILAAGRSLSLRRGAEGWTDATGRRLPLLAIKRLDLAIQFMNTAGPVRTMKPAEYEEGDLARYGLASLDLAVALFRGEERVLAAQFGATNPEGYLQYMRVQGVADLYLMSRFVGSEWREVVEAMGTP